MTKDERHEAGRLGEKASASYLRRRGYRIAAANYLAGHHEIDLVAETLFSLVFVEVKTRTAIPDKTALYGKPADAVRQRKQHFVSSAARVYLSLHPTSKRIRFDVMEVYLDKKEAHFHVTHINHIKNAYDIH